MGPPRNTVTEKVEWPVYQMVKNIEDTFTRFDRIGYTNVTDTQTDRHRTTA